MAERLRTPVVAGNAVAFAVAFALWVLLGPAVRTIAADLGFTGTQAAWLKALPILTGSVLRLPVGILTDRLGARWTFSALMVLGGLAAMAAPLAASFGAWVLVAFSIGLVGTTFVVGVQSVVSWTPKALHGRALGWFGAGNAGTAVATLVAPLLLPWVGWQGTFMGFGALCVLTGVAYAVWMRDPEQVRVQRTWADLTSPLGSAAAWGFGILYAANFGVYVAGALLFSDLYVDAYDLSLVYAGIVATSFTLTGALCRIPGGFIADRFGARPVVSATLLITAALLIPVALHPPLAVTAVLTFCAAVAMGIGMTATFKALPEVFPTGIGAVGGIVGMIGGLGAFVLPLMARPLEEAMGASEVQVLPLAALCVVAWVGMFFGWKQRNSGVMDEEERQAA